MKPLHSQEDHRAALEEMTSLMDAAPGSSRADRLEVLGVLVSEYERRVIIKEQEPDPVEVLGVVMRAKGLSQKDLSTIIGSRARASEVLSRKRSLSGDMVERVSAAWSVPRRLLTGQPRSERRPRKLGSVATVLIVASVLGVTALASPFVVYGRNLPDVAPLVAESSGDSFVSKLPPHVPQAFIAMEDQRFLSHNGYDPAAIVRAAGETLSNGAANPVGGATLTQQLVKNTLLKGESPSVQRKVREVLLARRLERELNKDQILGLYLTKVYFGNRAYGLESAAQHYFNLDASRLSVGQAAYLASLMAAPNDRRFDREGNHGRAIAARSTALGRMVDAGYITAELGREARRERLW